MAAYYNEHDKNAAAWLRELIKAGLIAQGEVDERSIEDVLPGELDGFTQCHFFAGIGVWSYALRCAGWPDDRKIWTGSCPCQPFSAAGKGEGTDDQRHLWPSFFWLIKQCQPSIIFGEQVASKDGLAWLDIVQSDLEAEKYAVAPFDLCAAGFGAPHIRQRLFFVGSLVNTRQRGEGRSETEAGKITAGRILAEASASCRVADSGSERIRTERSRGVEYQAAAMQGTNGQRERFWLDIGQHGTVGQLADANSTGRARQGQAQPKERRRDSVTVGRSATNGFWRDAEWLYCRDEKYRAVEPGTFPLVDGTPARVGRLRGYGNAIVAPVAEEFIRAYLTAEDE